MAQQASWFRNYRNHHFAWLCFELFRSYRNHRALRTKALVPYWDLQTCLPLFKAKKNLSCLRTQAGALAKQAHSQICSMVALFRVPHLVAARCRPFFFSRILKTFPAYFQTGTTDHASSLGRPTFCPHTCLSKISSPHQTMLGVQAWRSCLAAVFPSSCSLSRCLAAWRHQLCRRAISQGWPTWP